MLKSKTNSTKAIAKIEPNSYVRFHLFNSTSGSFDETMLFTTVVSASRRPSLILLVVELANERRGCNSPLSRKQFDESKEHAKI